MRRFLPILFLFVFLVSCKEDPKPVPQEVVSQETTTFYLIRHAEKDRSNPDNPDPELNQDGLGRSVRWAEVFDAVELDAVYTTDYERTRMTAAPTVVKKGLTEKIYEPGTLDLATLKAQHYGKHVLIVGHSNTTPELVNKFLGEAKYGDIDDLDNSTLFIVSVNGDTVTDIRLRIDLP